MCVFSGMESRLEAQSLAICLIKQALSNLKEKPKFPISKIAGLQVMKKTVAWFKLNTFPTLVICHTLP